MLASMLSYQNFDLVHDSVSLCFFHPSFRRTEQNEPTIERTQNEMKRYVRITCTRCARSSFCRPSNMERTVERESGKGGRNGKRAGGRRGKRAGRSYYGNTHARTRVSRFLWRAGSLRAAHYGAPWCSVTARYEGH